MKKQILSTLAIILIATSSFSQKVDTVFRMGIYDSYYSFDLKNPIIVTYVLHHGGGSCDRSHYRFKGDHFLKGRLATSTDYLHSGYDQGHMANAEDFAYDCSLDELTFRFYNCVPQTKELNRGIWERMEAQARSLSQTDSLLIICGNTFDSTKIGNGVYVPTTCWKVIYSLKSEQVLLCSFFTNTATPTKTDIDFEKLADIIRTRYKINIKRFLR